MRSRAWAGRGREGQFGGPSKGWQERGTGTGLAGWKPGVMASRSVSVVKGQRGSGGGRSQFDTWKGGRGSGVRAVTWGAEGGRGKRAREGEAGTWLSGSGEGRPGEARGAKARGAGRRELPAGRQREVRAEVLPEPGAGLSPRHSAARWPARKPGPHTQRKLPGVFSQRPGAQGGGWRRHSSTSESTGRRQRPAPPAPPPPAPGSSPVQRVPCGLSRKPESQAHV